MWLHSLYSIMLMFVFCNKIEIGRAVQFSKFKMLDKDTNSLCTDYYIGWEMSAPNAAGCAMKCYTNSQCLGTVYKVDEGVCYGLYSGNEAGPCATKTSGGIVYWKLPDICPSGWESVSKWCYKIIADEVWQTASDLCKSYSEVSHLAYAHAYEEHAAINAWFQSIGKDDRVWLGGYRVGNTENWAWDDGAKITIDFFWAAGEPENACATDCLLLFPPRIGFGDEDCTLAYTGLCELDFYN